MAKYTHGKTKGTSDRQSSRRTSAIPGETGGVIKDFRLSGAGSSQRVSTNIQDYYQSQPLNVPGPIQIPDAPEAPDDSQNLRNLANAFGDLNTNLKGFLSEVPQLQISLDKEARKRAEIQFEANSSLNNAKKTLEKKGETDPKAANSYGIFASMDQRVEREYAIVKAKRDGMDSITSFSTDIETIYQNSFSDETRMQDGIIIPLNPASPEFSQLANAYFAKNIPNAQARLELQPQIQAAIYSARSSLSSTHKTYKDSRANLTLENNIGSRILDSTKNDFKDGFTSQYTDFNQKGGSSGKNYISKTEPETIIADVAAQVILISSEDDLNANSEKALQLLLNTRLGSGNGIQLSKLTGGEKKLRQLWRKAISKEINENSRILDNADQQRGEEQALSDYDKINLYDADFSTVEIESIVDENNQRVIEINGVKHYVDSGPYAVNIRSSVKKIDSLLASASEKFSNPLALYAYQRKLNQLKNNLLETQTSGQRQENYEFLKDYVTAPENLGKGINNKQLIEEFYQTGRIDRDHYNLLYDEVNPNYLIEKDNWNILINGDGNKQKGILPTVKDKIIASYAKEQQLNITNFDQWPATIKSAVQTDIDNFQTEINEIFNSNDTFQNKIKKLNELKESVEDKIDNQTKTNLSDITGINSDDGRQIGTGKLLTNNNQDNSGVFILQEPSSAFLESLTASGINLSDVGFDYATNNSDFIKIFDAKSISSFYTPILSDELNLSSDLDLTTLANSYFKPQNQETNKQTFIYERPRELIQKLQGGLKGRGNDQENSSLAEAVRTNTLYSTPILMRQIELISDYAQLEVVQNRGPDKYNSWHVFNWMSSSGSSYPYNVTSKAEMEKLGLKYPRTKPLAPVDALETGAILKRINKHMSAKEYFIIQAKLHNLPLSKKVYEHLDLVFPDPRNSQFQFEETTLNKDGPQSSNPYSLKNLYGSQEIAQIASTDLSWMPAQKVNSKQDLETKMLNIIHKGESTVDKKGNGYEAFNQGGADEGKTVLGFSGTYGDHPANKGKKLTEMTIQEILEIQDSGYNTELYPFNAEGTKKWNASGGIHAAGRYQFTRVGLREALKRSGIKPTEKFSPEIQDKLALTLLLELGPNQWTSMKGNKELEKLLDKYNKTDWTKSSTIDGRSNPIA